MHYIQYNKTTGAITGTVSTGREPVILPEMSIAQLAFEDHQGDVHCMRVNLKTKQLEPCPEIAKARAIAEVDTQLIQIDQKRMRAISDALLGDTKALQNLEAQAQELRDQRKKILG
jgi:hypothetical protein